MCFPLFTSLFLPPPQSIYPFLTISCLLKFYLKIPCGPFVDSVSLSVSQSVSQSVRTWIGKAQTSLFPSSLMSQWPFFSRSPVHLSHGPLIKVIILTYIIISPASVCVVLEGRDFGASIVLFPEHFTWQLVHSKCPHLFGNEANSVSHWSSKNHYNPSKAMSWIITGEPSPRNISPPPTPQSAGPTVLKVASCYSTLNELEAQGGK